MEILITIGNRPALLRSNENCLELCFQRSQRGCETWTPEKYYSTLVAAFIAILEMKIRASTATTLSELKKVMEDSHRELRAEYGLEYRIKKDTAG